MLADRTKKLTCTNCGVNFAVIVEPQKGDEKLTGDEAIWILDMEICPVCGDTCAETE